MPIIDFISHKQSNVCWCHFIECVSCSYFIEWTWCVFADHLNSLLLVFCFFSFILHLLFHFVSTYLILIYKIMHFIQIFFVFKGWLQPKTLQLHCIPPMCKVLKVISTHPQTHTHTHTYTHTHTPIPVYSNSHSIRHPTVFFLSLLSLLLLSLYMIIFAM